MLFSHLSLRKFQGFQEFCAKNRYYNKKMPLLFLITSEIPRVLGTLVRNQG
jgi:hypothetical protein